MDGEEQMTIESTAPPRVVAPSNAAVGRLARIEGLRMLRHPMPWICLALCGWWLQGVFANDWSSAIYEGLLTSLTPLFLGISLAVTSAFGREHVPVCDDAPMEPTRRSIARLLGGLPLVALAAVVVGGGAVWLRLRGGIDLGDEPGHTEHAYYSLPELLQPVLLAVLAVALGAAVVHLVRHRLVAWIVLFLTWFLVGGTYWMLQSGVARWLTPLQVQPVRVEVASYDANPATFPSSWLLSQPDAYQDHWARLVVSPSLAAWHDLYLVGLVLLALGIALPGRWRRALLAGGAVVAVLGVAGQVMATP
jgi:hypothetical protein